MKSLLIDLSNRCILPRWQGGLFAALTSVLLLTGCEADPLRPPAPNGPQTGQVDTNGGSTALPSTTDEAVADVEEPAQEETAADFADNKEVAPPIESFRPPDLRPRHDAARLKEQGIHEYASQRLLLYTDIDPEIASTLPPIIDQVFDAWEAYFGELPPARDGSEYQLTGYLIQDEGRFRAAGLLPVHLPSFAHGKHDGQQFWMYDSEYDYYRRHLMLHEATHCFMQAMGGTTSDVPVWYLEGMAELFATHTVKDDGTVSFGVMPAEKREFVGFGRIPMIQRAIKEGRGLTVNDVSRLQPQDFVLHNESYAWSWSLCQFADTHPQYRDPFRQLAREYVDEGFQVVSDRHLMPRLADLDLEWRLFDRHLCYGYDIERAAMEFTEGRTLESVGDSAQAVVNAGQGWQSSGVVVETGTLYSIQSEGRAVLAHTTKPWESEPQGISIRYNEGLPMGRLVGIVVSEPSADTGLREVSDVVDLGRRADFTPPLKGTLYLRVNDFWNELADNTDEYSVTVGVQERDN